MSLQLQSFQSSEIITSTLCSFRRNNSSSEKKQFHPWCGPCDLRNHKSSGQQICGNKAKQNKILQNNLCGSCMMCIKTLLSKITSGALHKMDTWRRQGIQNWKALKPFTSKPLLFACKPNYYAYQQTKLKMHRA